MALHDKAPWQEVSALSKQWLHTCERKFLDPSDSARYEPVRVRAMHQSNDGTALIELKLGAFPNGLGMQIVKV